MSEIVSPRKNPIVWVISLHMVGVFLLLCVFVNPPFVIQGGYDESLIDSGTLVFVEWCILGWWLIGRFLLPRVLVKSEGGLVWYLGCFVSVAGLITANFLKASQNADPGVESYFLGRGVGWIGISTAWVLWPLWKAQTDTGDERPDSQEEVKD
jgi:hypothetical protein